MFSVSLYLLNNKGKRGGKICVLKPLVYIYIYIYIYIFFFFFSYLNSLWPLQIGGVENSGIAYPNLNYTGFNGCIRKITNNNHMYDLRTPLKVVNAPEGCQKSTGCPYCNNQGYCEPYLTKSGVCVCDVGYSGRNCLTG